MIEERLSVRRAARSRRRTGATCAVDAAANLQRRRRRLLMRRPTSRQATRSRSARPVSVRSDRQPRHDLLRIHRRRRSRPRAIGSGDRRRSSKSRPSARAQVGRDAAFGRHPVFVGQRGAARRSLTLRRSVTYSGVFMSKTAAAFALHLRAGRPRRVGRRRLRPLPPAVRPDLHELLRRQRDGQLHAGLPEPLQHVPRHSGRDLRRDLVRVRGAAVGAPA